MLNVKIYIQDHLSSFRMILISFVLMILTGAFLLCLPCASTGAEEVTFLDALFTSTSAACVTGLVVFDTASQWTLFGRTVILILIQIGGVVRFMRFLVAGTFCIEGIGALCLLPVFAGQFGLWKGLGYAIFHSVSAFCNAGFDLMGTQQQFSSLTSFSANAAVNITIMLLIILGGLGFLTWSDLISCRFRLRKLRLQSKIILTSTAALILLPALYFYFCEFRGNSGSERLLLSLFQAVTPRTAGFNTADYAQMSEGSWLITIILMMIGGAPGSTAGGMKVTTMAVLLLSSGTFLHRRNQVNCFHRRIENDAIRNAMALLTLYIFLLLGGTLLISSMEELPILPSMFECASALGTVGLTTGITTGLCSLSKALLISFMFFGRIGGLTLGYAFASSAVTNIGRMPVEKVSVG